MGEFLPLLFGVAVGLFASRREGRLRLWAGVALCIALGAAASWINGELAETGWAVLFDSVQVLAASAMTFLLVRRTARSRAPRSSR